MITTRLVLVACSLAFCLSTVWSADMQTRNGMRYLTALHGLVDPESEPIYLSGVHIVCFWTMTIHVKGIQDTVDPDLIAHAQITALVEAGGEARRQAMMEASRKYGTRYGPWLFLRLDPEGGDANPTALFAISAPLVRTQTRGAAEVMSSETPISGMRPLKWFTVARLPEVDPDIVVTPVGHDAPVPVRFFSAVGLNSLDFHHPWGVVIDGASDYNVDSIIRGPLPALVEAMPGQSRSRLAEDGLPFGVGHWTSFEVRDIHRLWLARQENENRFPLPVSVIRSMSTELGRQIALTLASESFDHATNVRTPMGDLLRQVVLESYAKDEPQRPPLIHLSRLLRAHTHRSLPQEGQE